MSVPTTELVGAGRRLYAGRMRTLGAIERRRVKNAEWSAKRRAADPVWAAAKDAHDASRRLDREFEDLALQREIERQTRTLLKIARLAVCSGATEPERNVAARKASAMLAQLARHERWVFNFFAWNNRAYAIQMLEAAS